jgi:hypothetical protein
MKTLIFSHLYQLAGTSAETCARLYALLDLWYEHLRGPGRYTGDVVLFSNVNGLERPGLTVMPFEAVSGDSRRAFLQRILWYDRVPAREYDVAMQLDLDVLAMNDVGKMFPRDERLWAAPSDLRALEWRHAWTLLPKWRRGVHKLTGWRMNQLGISACVVASATSTWQKNFGAWARAIRDHGDRPLPHFSDQSFLNLLFVKHTVPISSWSRDLIVHLDWEAQPGACLMHFPGRRKSNIPRFQKVGMPWAHSMVERPVT